MAGNSLGGYTPLKLQGFSRQQETKTPLEQQASQLFRPNSAIRPQEQVGIAQRNQVRARNEAKEQAEFDNSIGQRVNRADAQQEGNVAIGRIGRNTPGDTRMAQVLSALGIQPDLMRAIVASAQIRQSDNR